MADNQPESLANYSRAASRQADRVSPLGGVLTIGGHVLLVVALLYGGWRVTPQMEPEKVVEVALLPAPAPALDEAQPQLQFNTVRVEAPRITPPVIDIAQPDAPPITLPVQTAPPSSEIANGTSDKGKSEYVALLRRHLMRFMRSPGAEGVVTLRFFIDKSGRLLSAEIAESSGSKAVDAEALALVARAQPLPPIPDALKMAVFGANLPIAYHFDPALPTRIGRR